MNSRDTNKLAIDLTQPSPTRCLLIGQRGGNLLFRQASFATSREKEILTVGLEIAAETNQSDNLNRGYLGSELFRLPTRLDDTVLAVPRLVRLPTRLQGSEGGQKSHRG